MARTYTTNYNLIKPAYGEGDADNWDDALNSNFDTIDTNLKSTETTADTALQPADIATIKEPFYLGEDFFPSKMPYIRNEEMNNLLDTAAGTEITVTALNTTTKSVTFSWVPYIKTLFNPTSGKEWAAQNLRLTTGPADPSRSGDYTNIFILSSGTYSTKTFTYTSPRGADTDWLVGDKITFYNPFESNYDFPSGLPIISNSAGSSWRQQYVLSGGTFKHSNGDYIVMVIGTNSQLVACTTGAASASQSDFTTWTLLNSDTPIFSGSGINDWRRDAIAVTSVIKLNQDDRYIGYCYGYNSLDAKWRLGWVKFDEDFSTDSIEYSSGEIIDSSGSSNGFYGVSVIRYGTQYRMVYCDRDDNANPDLSTNPWSSKEAFSDTPEGMFVYNNTICTGRSTNDGIYRSNHTDHHCYFLYKGRLYLLVGGTARYLDSGTRGNRAFGMFYWDERKATPAWVEDIRSPIFINTFYGDQLWGTDYDWQADHTGIAPYMMTNSYDGKIYLFFNATHGSDNYRIGLVSIDIQNL